MIMVFPDHARLIFLMSAVGSVIMICFFLTVLWVSLQFVIVAVPGRTHLLFKITFSIQFLKMVRQKQQNSLMIYCHLHEF